MCGVSHSWPATVVEKETKVTKRNAQLKAAFVRSLPRGARHVDKFVCGTYPCYAQHDEITRGGQLRQLFQIRAACSSYRVEVVRPQPQARDLCGADEEPRKHAEHADQRARQVARGREVGDDEHEHHAVEDHERDPQEEKEPVEEELVDSGREAHDEVKDEAEGQRDEEDVGHLGDGVADGVGLPAVHLGRLPGRRCVEYLVWWVCPGRHACDARRGKRGGAERANKTSQGCYARPACRVLAWWLYLLLCALMKNG